MPYASNQDLPPSIRNHLPPHAQEIFRAAFNNAYDEYFYRPDLEELAHRVGWAAVKRAYVKSGNAWVPKASRPEFA